MPFISQVRQDTLLTNIAVTWEPTGRIADEVAPPVPVKLEDGQYIVFGKEGFNVPEAQRRPRAEYKEIDWTLSEDSYHAEEYGLQTRIDDRERNNAAAPLDLDETSTEVLTDNILNVRERRIANMVLSTTNVTQNATLAGTDQWSHALGGDPIGDAITAQSTIQGSTGYLPNTLAVGFDVWQYLRTNPTLRTALDVTRVLATEEVAELMGVETILIGSMLYNTAKAGQTVVLGDAWGKDALFFYRNPRPSTRRPSFAYQFVVQDLRVFRWRNTPVNCDMIRVNEIRAEKIVAATLAYLYKAAVA